MKDQSKETVTAGIVEKGLSRRSFLNYAGLAGAGILIASCNKDDDTEPVSTGGTVDFGSGDKGLLNYAFALEQLEAAFYTKVCTSFPVDMSEEQQRAFTEIRDHEIAHRELLRNTLKADAIGILSFNFDSINFADKQTVLSTAAQFEDIGISAYLGIITSFTSPDYMLAIMKIASVEGRHASYVKGQIDSNSFSNGIDSNSLDVAVSPDDTLAKTAKYFRSTFSTRHLPK